MALEQRNEVFVVLSVLDDIVVGVVAEHVLEVLERRVLRIPHTTIGELDFLGHRMRSSCA